MTKKRFKNIGKDIFQHNGWWCSAGGEHCADVIATALNELHEENQRLEKELTKKSIDYNGLGLEYEGVIAENKELKCENEKLHDEVFRLRTELAYERTEKEKHSYSVDDFKKKLEKW